jgi:ABC-type glycerol-3-phosphate transport system substrate-binding protein
MAEHLNLTVNITTLENEAFKQKAATVMQSGDPNAIFSSGDSFAIGKYAPPKPSTPRVPGW